jgi:hypothetical protein
VRRFSGSKRNPHGHHIGIPAEAQVPLGHARSALLTGKAGRGAHPACFCASPRACDGLEQSNVSGSALRTADGGSLRVLLRADSLHRDALAVGGRFLGYAGAVGLGHGAALRESKQPRRAWLPTNSQK